MSTSNLESPTLQQTAQQTAAEFGPSAAKLEVAEKAVLLDDLRRIGANERDTVSRYQEMKVFGKDPGKAGKAEDSMGHIIIGDIYGRDVSEHIFRETSQQSKDEPKKEPKKKTEQPAQQPAQEAKASPWKTAALLAAMAAGGAGIGSAPWIISAMRDKPDVDTRNEYDIEKYIPHHAEQ